MKKGILFIAIISIAFSACKKKNDETPAVPKLKTSIIPDVLNAEVDTATYSYNSDGTVLQIATPAGAKHLFSYNGNMVTDISYDNAGGVSETSTYYLNTQGMADSMVEGISSYRYRYIYDVNGFKTIQKFYGPSNSLAGIINYTNDGSNISDVYYVDGVGNVTTTFHYTFYTDKLNTVGNANKGMSFLGKSSKNTTNVSTLTTGGNTSISTSSSTYDSQGRVTSTSFYSAGGSLFATNTYSYY
jgi:hypothetical protein